MRILVRADASTNIGAGHIMRCLTLCNALAERGNECWFIGRSIPEPMAGLILRRHELVRLPAATSEYKPEPGDVAHAGWLGVSQETDAEQCAIFTAQQTFDWMIVDHYALNWRFEHALRSKTSNIMVIDDLADRSHDCDVLLDQNMGRGPLAYSDLVPQTCRQLIGPTYALLRPEFADSRAQSLARRSAGEISHIMVSLGGFDADNVTSRVLDALERCDLPKDCRISVIMGGGAPWIEDVKAKASRSRHVMKVLVGVEDMAALMVTVDLAIGAAGSSTWERCCLGIPTVMIALADNQVPIAEAVSKALGHSFLTPAFSQDQFDAALTALFDKKNVLEAINACSSLCDGKGVERLADYIH